MGIKLDFPVMRNKSLELFLYSLFGFLLSCVVLSGSYRIKDGYWTPLRFLGKVRSLLDGSDVLDVNFIGDIYSYVIHNDSVKLFPSITELPAYVFYGYWEPRASVFIGLVLFILLVCAFSRSIQKGKYVSIGSLSILLTITSLLIPSQAALVRLTSVFASHRIIPAICVVCSTMLLFKNKKHISLPYKDVILLSLLSIVAMFSFANGFVLPLLTTFVLLGKYVIRDGSLRVRKILVFLIPVIIASILYFNSLNFDHHAELSANTLIDFDEKNIVSGLIFSIKLLSYLWNPLASIMLMIVLLPTPVLVLVRRFRRPWVSSTRNNLVVEDKVSLSRLSFVLLFYLSMVPMFIVSRGYSGLNPDIPPRYFLEASLASASFMIILILLNNNNTLNKIVFAIISIALVVKISIFCVDSFSENVESSGRKSIDEVIVECIQSHQYQDYKYLESECRIGKAFWHFGEENLVSHPSIKIDNPEEYSEVLFNTLNRKIDVNEN